LGRPGVTNFCTPPRKEKNPDAFDGRTTEWIDYLVDFEQVAAWNRWNNQEKGQQLTMCLRGNAQKILSDLTLGQLSDYIALRHVLSQRFDHREAEIAYRCEFRYLKRQKGKLAADYGYSLRRLAQKAYPTLRYTDIEPTS
jgi:hypothetical protein